MHLYAESGRRIWNKENTEAIIIALTLSISEYNYYYFSERNRPVRYIVAWFIRPVQRLRYVHYKSIWPDAEPCINIYTRLWPDAPRGSIWRTIKSGFSKRHGLVRAKPVEYRLRRAFGVSHSQAPPVVLYRACKQRSYSYAKISHCRTLQRDRFAERHLAMGVEVGD